MKNILLVTTCKKPGLNYYNGNLWQVKIESYFLGQHPITLTILSHLAMLSHFLAHVFKILHQMNLLQYTVLIHPYSKAILCTV